MIRRVDIRRRPIPDRLPEGEPLIARIMASRGAEALPDYRLDRLLAPTLGGLDRAVDLLCQAIASDQKILIVGDFDADGATGTTLAVRALKAMGARQVDWLVPDRFRHGYGLSPGLVDEIAEPAPDLVVTVDQGISSVNGVARARQRGMRVIVTDHHLPGPQLPAADAIVNPNLPGETFDSRALAGVGVMFYLVMALRAGLRDRGWFEQHRQPRLDQWLDLVALGTVADLVPLDENNRRLVWQGLKRIRSGRCAPGLRALLEVAGRNLNHVSAADLGFAAAPRLNAAGRLDDMSHGIRCLLADNERQAHELAARLDELNRTRQQIQADMQALAEAQAERLADQVDGPLKGLCVFDETWHQGVVGLVAGRLADRLRRPVIALAPDEPGSDWLKGSGRSPSGVHMRDLLVDIDAAHPELIARFGGHARAAGLSLAREQLDRFRQAFGQQLETLSFSADQVLTDGELPPDRLDVATALSLVEAGPWGQGWPEPLFDGRFHVADRRIVGERHLKLTLTPVGGDQTIDAIAFNAGPLCHESLPDPLHLTYRLEVNRWQGRVSPQLNIQHLVSKVG